MPTPFSHAIAAVAIGSAFKPTLLPRSVWVTGAVCSIVPDLDVLGFGLGIHYGDFWGHRGFSHSILFAAIFSLLMACGFCWRRNRKHIVFLYLFLATAFHGILDAFTNGGLGVAFFSPLDDARYFFPFQPIQVSPIGAAFFSSAAIPVLASEAIWVWLPSAAFMCVCFWILKRKAA